MKLEYEGFSETGMVRGVNQDALAIFGDGEKGLFLVADGMGGHCQGERASRELKEACARWWGEESSPASGWEMPRVLSSLKGMLTLAGRKVWEDTEPGSICGAAYVLLWICGPSYALVWTGDCRCYRTEQRLWGRRTVQMTMDDCWENQPDCVAGLSQAAIRNHPSYGKLTRAAGAKKNLACSVQTGSIEGRTLFMLCSDGIHRYAGEKALEASMRVGLKRGGAGGALERIRGQVYERGAPDNLSCILVRAEV